MSFSSFSHPPLVPLLLHVHIANEPKQQISGPKVHVETKVKPKAHFLLYSIFITVEKYIATLFEKDQKQVLLGTGSHAFAKFIFKPPQKLTTDLISIFTGLFIVCSSHNIFLSKSIFILYFYIVCV